MDKEKIILAAEKDNPTQYDELTSTSNKRPPMLLKPITLAAGELGNVTIDPRNEINFGSGARIYRCDVGTMTYVARVMLDESISEYTKKISDMILKGIIKTDYIMPVYANFSVALHTIDGEKMCFVEILPYAVSLALETMGVNEISTLLPCIANGLKELHDHGIAHADIKPSNLFKLGKDRYVIGDFSASMIKNAEIVGRDEYMITTSKHLTPGFAPPERHDKQVFFSGDYYSLALTVLSLLHGEEFTKDMVEGRFNALNATQEQFMFNENSVVLAPLLRSLLSANANDRGGYNEIMDWCRNPDKFNREFAKRNSASDTNYAFFHDGKTVATSEKGLMEYLTSENRYEILYDGGINNSEVLSYLNRIGSSYVSTAMEIIKGINQGNFTTDDNKTLGKEAGLAFLAWKIMGDGVYRWRGHTYSSLSELADEMMENYMTNDIISLLSSGFISYTIGDSNKQYSSYISFAEKEISSLNSSRNNIDIDKEVEFRIELLYRFLYHTFKGQHTSAEKMFDDFSASVNKLDYSDFDTVITINEWAQIMFYKPYEVYNIGSECFKKHNGYDKARLFIKLMETLVSEENKHIVRIFNYTIGPDALFTYIKNNSDLYISIPQNGSNTSQYVKNIKDVDISMNMSVDEQNKGMELIAENVKELYQKDFQNNMLMSYLEISDGKSVTSHNVKAYFSPQIHNSGIPFTFGYIASVQGVDVKQTVKTVLNDQMKKAQKVIHNQTDVLRRTISEVNRCCAIDEKLPFRIRLYSAITANLLVLSVLFCFFLNLSSLIDAGLFTLTLGITSYLSIILYKEIYKIHGYREYMKAVEVYSRAEQYATPDVVNTFMESIGNDGEVSAYSGKYNIKSGLTDSSEMLNAILERESTIVKTKNGEYPRFISQPSYWICNIVTAGGLVIFASGHFKIWFPFVSLVAIFIVTSLLVIIAYAIINTIIHDNNDIDKYNHPFAMFFAEIGVGIIGVLVTYLIMIPVNWLCENWGWGIAVLIAIVAFIIWRIIKHFCD